MQDGRRGGDHAPQESYPDHSYILQGDLECRDRRVPEGGELPVVEADDLHILRHPDAMLEEGGYGTGRDIVILGEEPIEAVA